MPRDSSAEKPSTVVSIGDSTGTAIVERFGGWISEGVADLGSQVVAARPERNVILQSNQCVGGCFVVALLELHTHPRQCQFDRQIAVTRGQRTQVCQLTLRLQPDMGIRFKLFECQGSSHVAAISSQRRS